MHSNQKWQSFSQEILSNLVVKLKLFWHWSFHCKMQWIIDLNQTGIWLIFRLWSPSKLFDINFLIEILFLEKAFLKDKEWKINMNEIFSFFSIKLFVNGLSIFAWRKNSSFQNEKCWYKKSSKDNVLTAFFKNLVNSLNEC